MSSRIKSPKDPSKLVNSGIFALKRKKWAKARRKFEAALLFEEIQRNAGVWGNLGIALTNLKLLPEAKRAFDNAVNLNKKNPELWIKKGILEFQLEYYDDAEKSFERAKGLDKKNPQIPIYLSRTLRKKGLIKKGIKTLEAALKKIPQSSEIPIELARVWNQENNPEKAAEVLEKAIDNSSIPDPGLVLGQMYLDRNEFDKATRIYQNILIRFPNSRHAQYGIGVAYHATENWTKALQAYQKALKLFHPDKPPQSIYINLARVLKSLNRNKEAIDSLYQAKKVGKPTLEIALLLSELFLQADRPDRARRTLEDAVNLDKNNPAIYFYLGMTLLQLNDINNAKTNFRTSLRLDPKFHESKLQLSVLAIQENKLKEAFSLAYEVATEKPEHVPAHKLAAKLAFDLQNFRITIKLLNQIVRNAPMEHLEELELLLRSWLMLSQPEKAQEFMETLLTEEKELKNLVKSKSFFSQFL